MKPRALTNDAPVARLDGTCLAMPVTKGAKQGTRRTLRRPTGGKVLLHSKKRAIVAPIHRHCVSAPRGRKFTPGILLFALATGATLACGSTRIELQVDPPEITAGGIDFAQITAIVYKVGDPVGQGAPVQFETTLGSFSKNEDVDELELSTNASSRISLELYSSPSPGTANVTAKYDDPDSRSKATASVSIRFTSPQGTSLPVSGSFRMNCDAVNVGALRVPTPDIYVTCRLSAQTARGQEIPASALQPQFLAEAGTLTAGRDQDDQVVGIYRPSGGSRTPQDVPADIAGERSYVDLGGRTRNPRDGLVTLMAIIDGQEAFEDVNGNGYYDRGEGFMDLAEPFVDADDDGIFDLKKGDTFCSFCDVNGNGQWDAPNGQWDENTKITAIYKILWTGELYSDEGDDLGVNSRIEFSGNQQIPNGGQLFLTAYPLDVNLNPIAAFPDNSDHLEWRFSGGADADSNDPTRQSMPNEYGFSFDKSAKRELFRWRVIPNSFRTPTYNFTIFDRRPTDDKAPTTYSVTAEINVSPGKDADDRFLEQATDRFLETIRGIAD